MARGGQCPQNLRLPPKLKQQLHFPQPAQACLVSANVVYRLPVGQIQHGKIHNIDPCRLNQKHVLRFLTSPLRHSNSPPMRDSGLSLTQSSLTNACPLPDDSSPSAEFMRGTPSSAEWVMRSETSPRMYGGSAASKLRSSIPRC